MAEFRVTAPRDTSAMGSVYGAAPDSSVQWLRQYLPRAAGDFLAGREQQALQPASPREVAGDVISTAMNVLPAGPRMAVPRSQGIRAYHGSPYDFDRFDLSKIGTGEGAQAYGHGLYFAENPKVAAEYKAKLAPKTDMEAVAQTVAQKYGLDWSNMSSYERMSMVDRVAKDPELSAMGTDRFPNGRMYEVNINAKPEQFLDFDKPLGAQAPQIQSVAQQLIPRRQGYTPDLSGQEAYSILGTNLGELRPVVGGEPGHLERSYNPMGASAALRDAGIPGIRYPDRLSRGAEGKGTSNYVLFNDQIIDILKKYGLAGGIAGAGAASQDQSSQ